MNYKEQFDFWLNDAYFDAATKEELLAIRNDEKEIEDRFYIELEFGTGGLRGVIGAGTNRMNIYTVRKQHRDLQTILKKKADRKKVLLLHMIPVTCLLNLLMKQLFVLQQTESKHMYLMHSVQLLNYPLHSAHLDVSQVS